MNCYSSTEPDTVSRLVSSLKFLLFISRSRVVFSFKSVMLLFLEWTLWDMSLSSSMSGFILRIVSLMVPGELTVAQSLATVAGLW